MFYTLTYFSFLLIISLSVLGGVVFFKKAYGKGIIAALVILAVGSIFYFSFLDNYLARRWGGTLVVKLPENSQLVGMTWKETSLWYQYYLPSTNECVFRESSPIGLVEGEVRTPNCNPVGVAK